MSARRVRAAASVRVTSKDISWAPIRLRAPVRAAERAKDPAKLRVPSRRQLALRDWPVSRRLVAVIVLALVMGLVFGGLRVASAADSAAQFGRVAQLAKLGEQVTGLVQALQDERDQTTGLLPVTSPKDLQHWYKATDTAAAKVRALAARIAGSYPTNIRSRAAAVVSVITNLSALRSTARASQSALAVIADYAAPIGDMVFLTDQIAQGTSDSRLVNDVQALNSLALAKDQAAQQRALLFNALNQQLFADGVQQAVNTAQSEELNDLTAFDTTATPAEQSAFRNTVAGPLVNKAQSIETYVLSVGSLDIGAGALGISATAAPARWYSAMSGTVDDMQQVERRMARSIVARAQSLERSAEESALINAVLTARDPAPGVDRHARGRQVPCPAAAQAKGRRAQHRHGAAARAGPGTRRGHRFGDQSGGGADQRGVRR